MQLHSVTIDLTRTHAQYGVGRGCYEAGEMRTRAIEYEWTFLDAFNKLHGQHTQPDRTAQLRQRRDRRHDNHAHT